MKRFTDHIDEALEPHKDSKDTLLNYLAMSFVKLANAQEVNDKSFFLLLGATMMASIEANNSTMMSRKLAQLALSKSGLTPKKDKS